MKIEMVTLFDGTEIVYVRQSKRKYVRVTKDSVTVFKRKKRKQNEGLFPQAGGYWL
jgi:hypothetical protein